MAIKDEVLDAMVAAGATSEMIVAAIKADRAARSAAAVRQARYRDRRNALRNGDVTERNGDAAKEISPTPPKENKPSLREGNINNNISRTREKRRSVIAENAQPTPKDRDAANAAGLSEGEFRSQWAKFRDHHRAKGSLMADWPAAWRTWLGNIGQFQPARAGPTRLPQNRNGLGAVAREMLENDRQSQEIRTVETLSLLPIHDDLGRGSGQSDDGGLPRKAVGGYG